MHPMTLRPCSLTNPRAPIASKSHFGGMQVLIVQYRSHQRSGCYVGDMPTGLDHRAGIPVYGEQNGVLAGKQERSTVRRRNSNSALVRLDRRVCGARFSSIATNRKILA